jgi:hypothetical protein
MNHALLDIAHVEINIAFWASLMFPVVTRFFWPWHQSWWGWNTVLLELSIAGTLFPSWLFLMFHVTNSGLEWSQIVFLGLVTLNILWRTVMIWRTQREGRARDEGASR